MRTPVGLDSTLGKTIPNGVAYHQIHHAGKYQHKFIMRIKEDPGGARLYPEEDCRYVVAHHHTGKVST